MISLKEIVMGRPKKGVTFWDRVEMQTVQQENGCMVFTGHKDEYGYGRISKGDKLVRIHREVWLRENPGQTITGVIMHSCDNPSCINPAHLSHGTQADNMADMVAKGRRITLKGSQQHDAKLTEADIPKIRELIANPRVYMYKIAEMYGVSETVIRNIRNGKNWSHVP